MRFTRFFSVHGLFPIALSGSAVLALASCDDGGAGSGGAGAGGSGNASSGGAPSDSGSGGDAGASGGAAGAGGCVRAPGPADGPRKLIVSHPYDASSQKSDRYEVLELDAAGKLTQTGKSFQLGRSTNGEIVFTPDGELGFVATEEGRLGVFRVEPSGDVTVLEPGLTGAFYAAKLVMAPAGDRVFVLDDEWRDVGGGIYSVKIGCDDQVTEEGLLAPAKLPAGLWLSQKTAGRAWVAASDILGSPADQHLHVLDWSPAPTLVASAVIFGQDAPIISSLAVTVDETYALIGDNSGFSSVPNRVAVVSLSGATPTALQELPNIEDPADIETSPFDATALVSSGFGNALLVLEFDASKPSAPYSAKPLAYQGGAPQLPIDMVQLRRGALTGRVFVAEVPGVRQVAFAAGKPPVDLGVFALGSGTENVPGSLGIQP